MWSKDFRENRRHLNEVKFELKTSQEKTTKQWCITRDNAAYAASDREDHFRDMITSIKIPAKLYILEL